VPRQSSPRRPILEPEDRRREVVAILARGLVRLRPARRKKPESLPETPCSGAENTAQCDPRVNGKERVAR